MASASDGRGWEEGNVLLGEWMRRPELKEQGCAKVNVESETKQGPKGWREL